MGVAAPILPLLPSASSIGLEERGLWQDYSYVVSILHCCLVPLGSLGACVRESSSQAALPQYRGFTLAHNGSKIRWAV